MNNRPVFRNPDKFQVLLFRDYLRKHLPGGREGCVIEDLDLIIRLYGKQFNTDDDGKFYLFELKFGNARIGIAQQKTFGLIHRLLRMADPRRERYLGYYVINYDNEDWEYANFSVNGVKLSREEFLNFLQNKNVGEKGTIPNLTI
jgi:hypothetical protein